MDALEAGADDYLVKPLRERELLSRVNALGRRLRNPKQEVLEAGPYRGDFTRRSILRADEPVELSKSKNSSAADPKSVLLVTEHASSYVKPLSR